MKPCLLFLTCTNSDEAEKIETTLLEKRLVVCIKKSPVSSRFLFQGKIDHAKEILLIMDSIEENFSQIEKEIKKLHSYKTFVLISVPVIQTTNEVKKWLQEELK